MCTPKGQTTETEIESWELFFDNAMLESITDFTNIKIDLLHYLFQCDRDTKEMSVVEIHTLYCLLYVAGMTCVSYEYRWFLSNRWYWSRVLPPCYAKKMVSVFTSALRFDNVNTRDGQRELDRLVAIWKIYEKFSTNIHEVYLRVNILQLMKWWYHSAAIIHSRFISRKSL